MYARLFVAGRFHFLAARGSPRLSIKAMAAAGARSFAS